MGLANYFVIYFFLPPTASAKLLDLTETDRLLVILVPIIGALIIICTILGILLYWYRCRDSGASCACYEPVYGKGFR